MVAVGLARNGIVKGVACAPAVPRQACHELCLCVSDGWYGRGTLWFRGFEKDGCVWWWFVCEGWGVEEGGRLCYGVCWVAGVVGV